MSKSSHDGSPAPNSRRRDDPSLLATLEADMVDPNKIVTSAPEARFLLGYLDVTCLVLNHVIGTGIFNSPGRVIAGTNSTGAALFFWLTGIIVGLCGFHVYVEYGLNVPRYNVDGVEQNVPRSGGDLHYLHYVYRKPRFRKDVVLFFPCLYGIAFICLGNMAGNSISFAVRVLQAAHPGSAPEDISGSAVRGVAIAVAIATCFIHTVSRRGGIILNNVIAILKVCILLLIIVTAIAVSAGGFHNSETGEEVPNVIGHNLDRSTSFKPISEEVSGEANDFAQAFLAIIFAFSAFNQTNYVLGEVDRPRKTFPISMMTGASILAVLYMAVNICYMVVVPKEQQIGGRNVAEEFFKLTYGALGGTATGEQVFNTFLAISSLGNVIVMTFTAARMKQEIAKEGFLPFAKFFAQDYDLSLGRLLRWLQSRGWCGPLVRHKWFSPEAHQEKTPVGAFILHFASCLVLILATWRLEPDDAYNVLSSAWVYLFPAFFGFFLALGILILRFTTPPKTAPLIVTHDYPGIHDTQNAAKRTWTDMTDRSINPHLSVVCAVIYLLGCAYPVIVSWVPPSNDFGRQDVVWFLIPTIACGVLGFASLWFLGFLAIGKRKERRLHQAFVIERHPVFEWAEGAPPDGEREESDRRREAGGLVLVSETVSLVWKGNDVLELERMRPEENGLTTELNGINGVSRVGEPAPQFTNRDPFAGTDFANTGR